MADGVRGVSQNMPFNVGSDIHAQTRARERIETHLVEQRVEKAHRANHSHLEALAKQRFDLQESSCLEDHATSDDVGDDGNVHSRFRVGDEP